MKEYYPEDSFDEENDLNLIKENDLGLFKKKNLNVSEKNILDVSDEKSLDTSEDKSLDVSEDDILMPVGGVDIVPQGEFISAPERGMTQESLRLIIPQGEQVVLDSVGRVALEVGEKAHALQASMENYEKVGDARREDLIQAYEAYGLSIRRHLAKTEIDPEQVEDGPFRDGKDGLLVGNRVSRYVAYDTEARAQLLRAGFPVSEIADLSELYVLMKGFEHEIKGKENAFPVYKTMYETIRAAWNDVIDSAPVTAANHKELKEKLSRCGEKLLKKCDSEDVKESRFGEVADSQIRTLSGRLKTLKDNQLSLREKSVLSATSGDLYHLLDNKNIDPGHVRSSSEFKAMKEALKKLSEVDRRKHPMQYEVLRDEAIRCTNAYLRYKKTENKPGHKRSQLEARRVLTANTILDALHRMEDVDRARENSHDERIVVSDDMDFADAKEFIQGYQLLSKSMENMLQALNSIKLNLRHSQDEDDRNKNFENKDELVGSKYYRAMTQSLQNCIEVMSNKASSIRDIQDALSSFRTSAEDYYTEKQGIFGGPSDPVTEFRCEFALSGVKQVSVFVPMIDNVRLQLDSYKTRGNMFYRDKNLIELGRKAAELSETFRDELREEPAQIDKGEYGRYYALSSKQVEVRGLIRAKNKDFVSGRYFTDRKPDYYPTQKRGAAVGQLAKDFVSMKYLDRIYKKNVSNDKLNQVKAEIENGSFDKEVKRLSTDPIFKSMAEKYPEKLFSKWKGIEKKSAAIMDLCENNLKKFEAGKGLGGPFKTIEKYIEAAISKEYQKLELKPEKEIVYAIDPNEVAEEVEKLRFDKIFPNLAPYKNAAIEEFRKKYGRNPDFLEEPKEIQEEKIIHEPDPMAGTADLLEQDDEMVVIDIMMEMYKKAAPKKAKFKAKERKPIQNEAPSPIITVCSDVMTNLLLTDEKYGKILSEAIAADPEVKPRDAIKEIRKDVQDFVLRDSRKTKLHPKTMIEDPKKMEQAFKHVLESQKNKVMAPKVQEKAPVRKNSIISNESKSVILGPGK